QGPVQTLRYEPGTADAGRRRLERARDRAVPRPAASGRLRGRTGRGAARHAEPPGREGGMSRAIGCAAAPAARSAARLQALPARDVQEATR
ncbi:MAG: hypothetical protein MZW92_65275, partial [Comamonadaceae bacterium]|nr:hypothetical protein [Comamonadaceae bacterium]